MIEYDGIIFTDCQFEDTLMSTTWYGYNSGPYRIRTELAYYGYNVRVVDMLSSWTHEELESILDSLVGKNTKFIGVSATLDFVDKKDGKHLSTTLKLIRLYCKSMGIKMILGGGTIRSKYVGAYFTHPLLNSKIDFLLLSEFDYVMSGFSEYAIKELVDYLCGKSDSIDHLDPQPYSEIGYDNVMYINGGKFKFDSNNLKTVWLPEDCIEPWDGLPIEISRGCRFNCAFCTFPLRGKKKFDYFRREQELYEDFCNAYENFGVTKYVFVDDTFNDSTEKIDLIYNVISRLPFKIQFSCFIKPELLVSQGKEYQEKLIDSGLMSCTIGLETLDKETRKKYKKGHALDKMFDALNYMYEYSNKSFKIEVSMIYGDIDHNTQVEQFQTMINTPWVSNFVVYVLGIMDYNSIRKLDKNVDPLIFDAISLNPNSYGIEIIEEKNSRSLMSKWIGTHVNVAKDFGKKTVDRINYEAQTHPDSKHAKAYWACSLPSIIGKNVDQFIKDDAHLLDREKYYEDGIPPNILKKQKMYDAIVNGVRTPIIIQKYTDTIPINFVEV